MTQILATGEIRFNLIWIINKVWTVSHINVICFMRHVVDVPVKHKGKTNFIILIWIIKVMLSR